ncbi:hypothetical protein [Ekhidna sp.]|uniref:hypothetical protein n=1 Tax=Ekhidna sp. TaxID=2608089 RepID=UPI003C79D65A
MNYLIVAENQLCSQLSAKLINEIRRFDIRHEIVVNPSNVKKQLKKSKLDLLIIIGTSKSVDLLNLAEKLKIKSCFFHQSLLDKTSRSSSPSDMKRVYSDIPIIGTDTPNVFLLSDIVRSLDVINTEEVQSTEVAIFYSNASRKKLANRISASLTKTSPDIEFSLVDISRSLKDAISTSLRSNAAIALDQFSNVFAAYTNCPTVNVYQKSLFSKPDNEKSVINRLLAGDAICNVRANNTESLADEINRVLNDHQYCAGIMQSYQELKSQIGIQPFARQAAQEIVDWLEGTD